MEPEGYWVKAGPGYNPKYRSTLWSLILLAQLGGSAQCDKRIRRACAYALDHAFGEGKFTLNGSPSGTIDCLQGNMCAALLALGCDDPRLAEAFEWMARTVTGEGLAPNTEKGAPQRYYASRCGPLFACGANNGKPCAWDAVKVMLAFAAWPHERRTPLITRAIGQGVEFLFSTDPAGAAYPTPTGGKPNASWFRFGFPVFYVTDVLQTVEALARLGIGHDVRLDSALRLVLGKQDAAGRWPLEYDYSGKTWVEFGNRHQPNPWVTIRALSTLRAADTSEIAQAASPTG